MAQEDEEMNFIRIQDVLLSNEKEDLLNWFENESPGIDVFFQKFIPEKVAEEEKELETKKTDLMEKSLYLQTNDSELINSTPIHYAIKNFDKTPNIFRQILQIIRERDSKMTDWSMENVFTPNWNVQDESGLTPVGIAVQIDQVEVLLELEEICKEAVSNRKVTFAIDEDNTVNTNYLGLSVICHSIHSLHFFLERDANVFEWDECGKRPVHLAVEYGFIDGLQILLDLDRKESTRKTIDLDMYLIRKDFHEEDLEIIAQNQDLESDSSNSTNGSETNSVDEENITQLRANRSENDSVNFPPTWNGDPPDMSEPSFEDGSDLDDDSDGEGGFLDLSDLLLIERQMAESGFEFHNDGNGNIIARLRDSAESDAFGHRDESDFGGNLLHLACRKAQRDVIRHLLTFAMHTFQINDTRDDGMTCSHIACKNNDIETLNLLLEEGQANFNIRNDILGMLPVHIACENASVEALKLLLDRGCDVNAKDENGYGPLHYAATNEKAVDSIELLISRGADVNMESFDGETPVYTAVSRWNMDTFWKLIDSGANPGISHSDGTVVLGFIAANSMKELTRFAKYIAERNDLKENVDFDIVIGDEEQTALHIAAHQDNIDAFTALLDAGADPNISDSTGLTPISIIMKSEKMKERELIIGVEALLKRGVDVNTVDLDGARPIHYACKKGYSKLVDVLVNGNANAGFKFEGSTCLHLSIESLDKASLDIILKTGVDLNVKNSDSLTPLMLCSKLHFAEGTKSLVMFSDKLLLNSKNQDGDTCLHICSRKNGFAVSNIIRLLVEHGADINAQNDDGEAPIHVHIRRSRIEGVRTLLELRCDLHTRSKNDLTPLMFASETGNISAVRMLLRAGANVNEENSGLHSCLFYFCDRESISVRILRLLLRAGGNILKRDKDGDTILHEASLGNNAAVIRFLARKGMNLNITNNNNETALFQASRSGHSEVVQILLQKNGESEGADPKIQDSNGVSAYQIARSNGHNEIVQMLLKSMEITFSTFAPITMYMIDQNSTNRMSMEGTDSEEDNICTICQDDLKPGDEVRILPCGHVFHNLCILPWIGGENMTNSKSCPICKQPICPENL